MSETPEQIADALEAYSAWCGGVHDEGCPEDDTCDCSGKRLNDGVTAAVNHLRACGSCFSVVDAIRRAEKAESLLASREEENRDQVALIHKLVHERDEAEATMSTLRDQVGRLRELVKQWRDEAKHNDREASDAQRRTALYHGPPNVEYHTAVNRRRVYTKCADGLDALLSGTQEQPK